MALAVAVTLAPLVGCRPPAGGYREPTPLSGDDMPDDPLDAAFAEYADAHELEPMSTEWVDAALGFRRPADVFVAGLQDGESLEWIQHASAPPQLAFRTSAGLHCGKPAVPHRVALGRGGEVVVLRMVGVPQGPPRRSPGPCMGGCPFADAPLPQWLVLPIGSRVRVETLQYPVEIVTCDSHVIPA
jgi:hypothetical protein